MPGLLETDDFGVYNYQFLYAVSAELVAVLLFSLLGSSAPSDTAAWANGFSLAVLVYITANISGGHLNPAVTLATLVTGHITIAKAIAYVVAQIAGAILGHLVQAGLMYGVAIGDPNKSLGVFLPGKHVSAGQAFGWEVILTFILVSTVFAVAIGKPSFGNVGPLAIGLSVFASATAGFFNKLIATFATAGHITGAALNPARVIGPAAVFNTGWSVAWYYILAELAGGLLAGLSAWPLYGTGPDYGVWHGQPQTRLRTDLEDVHQRLIGKREEA